MTDANPICHIELPSTDLRISKEFYERVFGWRVELLDDGEYAFFREPTVSGGFDPARMPSPDDSGPRVMIEVASIEDKIKEIVEAGGKLLKQRTLISEDFGYYALFRDPSGNTLGLWSKK